MENRKKISIRLKELRRAHKFSQSYVAEKLFVSQAAYSLMEGTQNAVTAEHILQLSQLYNVTTDYLLSGNKKLINMTPENGFLPLIDAKAHAGLIKNVHREDVMDDYEYYKIPGFNLTKNSVLIEIVGESMQPIIQSGDILICQIQEKFDYVLSGSVVVVVTEEEIFATRIHKHRDENFFTIEGDNPGNESKRKITKSEIVQLWMVLGKVSNLLVPHQELAFKGKLQSLEDSLDFLSKNFYKMEKSLKL